MTTPLPLYGGGIGVRGVPGHRGRGWKDMMNHKEHEGHEEAPATPTPPPSTGHGPDHVTPTHSAVMPELTKPILGHLNHKPQRSQRSQSPQSRRNSPPNRVIPDSQSDCRGNMQPLPMDPRDLAAPTRGRRDGEGGWRYLTTASQVGHDELGENGKSPLLPLSFHEPGEHPFRGGQYRAGGEHISRVGDGGELARQVGARVRTGLTT